MTRSYLHTRWWLGLALSGVVAAALPASAQTPQSRDEALRQAKAEKAKALAPYVPSKGEQWVDRIENTFLDGDLRWHPYFQSALAGGGFTLGAGYRFFVSPYNTVDLRGSYTLSGYKRLEAEFLAPRLFDRRGRLSLVGGWREATQVGFFGIGTDPTSKDDRVNYSFTQPYVSAQLDVWPTRRYFVVGGGIEYSKWDQEGSSREPSVEDVYTPATLQGLDSDPTYLHVQGSAGFDWRTAPGYTRRGGAYGVTVHDYSDRDGDFGFRQVDYDAVQHFPILRDAWVLSLHARAETTYDSGDQQVPFFMLPALGGGSSLRGFSSWRFRDRHSILLQAEWRVLVNRFLDVAVFADAGKVVSRTKDLNFDRLKNDYGLGFRFHGPLATPLRIELAHSNEGLVIVFSSKAPF